MPSNIPPFESMFSIEALLSSWHEFSRGKMGKADVGLCAMQLISNLSRLQDSLVKGEYRHGGYSHFKVSDPKPRDIHKASVQDRIVHHAIYRALYPYFDRLFIYDSYSCRPRKGTHRGLWRFEELSRKVSRNNTRTAWVLKGDIKKCFASIDHGVLKEILARHIECKQTLIVLHSVIDSFRTGDEPLGIPLGNLTSQLFVNIYMNELDQHMKSKLGAKHYIRYADDFVVISHDRTFLQELVPQIAAFLEGELKLRLHPDKLFIKTFASGIDFLGWVHFPHHRVLRTTTKKRMLRNLKSEPSEATIGSYRGMLSHGDAHGLQSKIFDD